MSQHEIKDFKPGERVIYVIASSGKRVGAVVVKLNRQRVSIRVDGTTHPRPVGAHSLYKSHEI